MEIQSVIGLETHKVYFKGDPIACRRFINDSQVKKGFETRVKSKMLIFGFDEALKIIWITMYRDWISGG